MFHFSGRVGNAQAEADRSGNAVMFWLDGRRYVALPGWPQAFAFETKREIFCFIQMLELARVSGLVKQGETALLKPVV